MSGIRITQAIDNNQILVNVNTFNYSVNPYPLKCPDPNCSAHLVYVKSHIRRSFNKTLHIPPSLDWKKISRMTNYVSMELQD